MDEEIVMSNVCVDKNEKDEKINHENEIIKGINQMKGEMKI